MISKFLLESKKLLPIIFVLVILVLAVVIVLSLPKIVDLAQAKMPADIVPQTSVISIAEAVPQIAGIEKVNPFPKSQQLPIPELSATSVLVEDANTGFVFFEKESNKRVPIASTTKIMTALVASEYFKPNAVLEVSVLPPVAGSTMGLKAGEQLSFRSLLYGMLLNSGNDAAFTIAANYPGGVSGFIEAMNKKAVSLNLLNTHFQNPAGFDNPDHFSSAADLAKIAVLVSEDSQLARVVSTKETSVASIDKVNIHVLKNLNKLLELPGVLGMKTGTTPLAKENLVGLVERDGHKILTVVLGSDDRFGETEKLINWTYSNFIWE